MGDVGCVPGPGSLFKPEMGLVRATGLHCRWTLAKPIPSSEIPSSVLSLPGQVRRPREAERGLGARRGEKDWGEESGSGVVTIVALLWGRSELLGTC